MGWNHIGRAIRVDLMTTSQMRGRFSQTCVQVNLKKALVPMVHILGYDQRIEYEGLHKICFECCQYGHIMEIYPSKDKSAISETAIEIPIKEQPKVNRGKEADVSNPFGPWMLVTVVRHQNLTTRNTRLRRS